MAEAFKCDRCKEFIGGEPKVIWLDVVSGIYSHLLYMPKKRLELCKKCFKDVEVSI